MRAGAVTLLTEYGADAHIRAWSVYRARPVTINAPQAFVNGIDETVAGGGDSSVRAQRTPAVEVIVVHGINSPAGYGEAADQLDAFLDGFIAWMETRIHAAGANRLIYITGYQDLLDWSPEWSDTETRTFYATRISLEGYGLVEA